MTDKNNDPTAEKMKKPTRKSSEPLPPKHMRTPRAIKARIDYLESEVAKLRKQRDAIVEDAKAKGDESVYVSKKYTGLSTRIYSVKQSIQMWEKRLRKIEAEPAPPQ
jgi:chromosome segregation ATPase